MVEHWNYTIVATYYVLESQLHTYRLTVHNIDLIATAHSQQALHYACKRNVVEPGPPVIPLKKFHTRHLWIGLKREQPSFFEFFLKHQTCSDGNFSSFI